MMDIKNRQEWYAEFSKNLDQASRDFHKKTGLFITLIHVEDFRRWCHQQYLELPMDKAKENTPL